MEGSGRRRIILRIWAMMIMVVITVKRTDSKPNLHKVGGSSGWIPNHNYTDWSNQERVFVGDWLIFVFDKHYFNVLEVNKTSYESCNDQGFISNITRGGRDVVQLTEARPYYYLSSGGYCWNGMKVVINVEEIPLTAPAPAPAKNGSPSNIGKQLILPISFYLALAWSVF